MTYKLTTFFFVNVPLFFSKCSNLIHVILYFSDKFYNIFDFFLITWTFFLVKLLLFLIIILKLYSSKCFLFIFMVAQILLFLVLFQICKSELCFSHFHLHILLKLIFFIHILNSKTVLLLKVKCASYWIAKFSKSLFFFSNVFHGYLMSFGISQAPHYKDKIKKNTWNILVFMKKKCTFENKICLSSLIF